MNQLSSGIITRLLNADPDDTDLFNGGHVVQLLSARLMPQQAKNPTHDRYRLMVSDGLHYTSAMLATQMNHIFANGAVLNCAILKVNKFSCSYVQGKRLIIILGLEVLSVGGDRIGTPALAPDTAQGAPSAAAASSATTAPRKPDPPPRQTSGHQQGPSRTNSGRDSTIYPIESLSPYQNNWIIKALVSQKSEIKTWSNQRGEGQLFNVTLIDDSGEIRATGFNAAVDELYEKLEEGKVYYISKARVNLAKKKFNNVQNNYELSFERHTEIEECLDTTNVPKINYNFVTLDTLQDVAKDATCDVIGIVTQVGPLGEITSKQSKQFSKRELTIADKSGFSVRLTLWGKQAEQFNAEDSPVIAVKGAKVGDFGGRSLSVTMGSTVSINPDIPQAFVLRGWYDSSGADQNFQSHSSAATFGGGGGAPFNRTDVMTLDDVKSAKLGESDNDTFSARATIMHIKADSIAYPACPGRAGQKCGKKVVQDSEGWRCEKCEMSHEAPEYRYIMSMAVADFSGQAWLQAFNEAGAVIFGVPADEAVKIKDSDETEYTALVAKASCNTYNFVCRAKMDTFNDQPRVRYSILRIQPLDYREEARFLVDVLRSPWAH